MKGKNLEMELRDIAKKVEESEFDNYVKEEEKKGRMVEDDTKKLFKEFKKKKAQ